jgi:hypothetical protein
MIPLPEFQDRHPHQSGCATVGQEVLRKVLSAMMD